MSLRHVLVATAVLASLLAAPLWAGTGGPDSYGYTWSDDLDDCPLGLPQLSDQAEVFLQPTDSIGPLLLPFTFPYFGEPVTQVWISPTGFVSFSDPFPDGASPESQSSPDPAAPNDLIAAFWSTDDLPLDIAVDATIERFVVWWNFVGASGIEPVALVLSPDGSARIEWQTSFQLSQFATVGYEDATGSQGLTLFRNGSPVDPNFLPFLRDGSVCLRPPISMDCSAPLELDCGANIASELPASLPLENSVYACDPEAHEGNERLVRLDLPATQRVRLGVDNPGLTLFELGEPPPCGGGTCRTAGDPEIQHEVLFPGSYWFAVDKIASGGGDPFEILAVCEELESIECGAIRSDDSARGPSSRTQHPCAPVPLNGPELAYSLRQQSEATLSVSLEGAPPDLWAVLYDSQGSCLTAGQGGTTLFAAPAGDYVLVVDGEDDSAGEFDLSPNCEAALSCDSPRELSCGQSVQGNTAVDGQVRVDRYNCSLDSFTGPEVVVSFTNPKVQNVSFGLQAADPSLDLLFLERCDEGYCRKVQDEALHLSNLPPGDYRLVVDGRNGASGEFTLATICGPSLTPESLEATIRIGDTVAEKKSIFLTPEIPKADVLFAIDLTSSMNDELASLQRNAIDIITQVNSVVNDLQFGLVSFEDYPRGFAGDENCDYFNQYGSFNDEPYRLDLPLSTDLSAFQSAVNGMSLGLGDDGPESYSRVFHEAVHDPAIGWREGSRRILVTFGDAIPHDCNVDACIGGGFPLGSNHGKDPGRDGQVGTPDDLAILEVLDEMAATGNDIVLLYFDSSGSAAFRDLWGCYAERTGGFVEALNPDGSVPGGLDLPGLVFQAIAEEGSQCDSLTLSPSTGFEDWMVDIQPPAYIDVALPAARTFDILLSPPAGTPPGEYEFRVDMLCEGVAVASQQVRLHVGDCRITAVAPANQIACENAPISLRGDQSVVDGCQGEVRYRWLQGSDVLRGWDSNPVFDTTVPQGFTPYTLEVGCFGDPSCTGTASASFELTSAPDPRPSALGNTLRVTRTSGDDLQIGWADLSGGSSIAQSYEVVVLDADVVPVPEPVALDLAPVLGEVFPDVERLLHVDGAALPCNTGAGETPCRLLFYKVRATSPCSGVEGPTCNGDPGQVPCP